MAFVPVFYYLLSGSTWKTPAEVAGMFVEMLPPLRLHSTHWWWEVTRLMADW